MAENDLELLFGIRNDFAVFVDELLNRSAKTALTLLIFVGLPDATIANFRTASNFRQLCNATKYWGIPLLKLFNECSNRLIDEIYGKTPLPEVDILVVNGLNAPWDDPTLIRCPATKPALLRNGDEAIHPGP